MSTYTPIASQTLTSATSSITLNNIPQNYTDLVIVLNALTSVDVVYTRMKFNSDSSTNYSNTYLEGDGSVANSNRYSNNNYLQLSYWNAGAGSNPETSIINIMNYSNSTTNKTTLIRYNGIGGAASGTTATVGLWRNTNAINTIEFSLSSGTFDSGSTFNLYGIASGSPKATGGTVTTDGTYFYHTFTSSNIFTPSQDLTVDYLVVAGGGSGGAFNGYSGGGGAGGLRCTIGATGGGGSLESPLSLTAQNYTVTIGAGGSGSNGSNSVFNTITATGGGVGGYFNGAAYVTGGTGGSGGGQNANQDGITIAGGSGTANQGYAGGGSSGLGRGGGGGGAGAAGSAGNASTPGNGGNGVATSISGSSVTYAGGGGGSSQANGVAGGTGGTGGGGTGAIGNNTTVGSAGTANTGGGGGGSAGIAANGGAGGSGIVIVRYAV